VIEPARVDAFDDVYVLFDGESPRWQTVIRWGEHAHVPFREELVWEAAGVAVVGGGAAVYFLDLTSGALRHRLDVPCLFGHLALDHGEAGVRGEALYVLGWTDAIAIAPSLQTRWWARNLAVDGVVFHETAGALIRLGVEMDPPGGWFEIEVEAATGRELSRRAGVRR